MNLLHSLTTGGATKELSNFVTCWLVPLFILFNVIGWLGLTQREADRSDPRPSDKDTSDLGRAIWRAWLVGILAALAGLWFIFAFCEPSLKSYSPSLVDDWNLRLCRSAFGNCPRCPAPHTFVSEKIARDNSSAHPISFDNLRPWPARSFAACSIMTDR
jgi:hypothetical protein